MTRKNLSDAILAHMRAHPSQPMTKSDLAHQLKVPSDQRAELRKAIEGLVGAGDIHEGKKSCYFLRAQGGNSLVGTLKFHPKGHAFFFPDATDESNLATGIDLATNSRIHVPRRDCGTSLDGDRVMISIAKPSPKRLPRTRGELFPTQPDEISGRVEKVLARRSGRLVGTYRQNRKFGWVECQDKAIDGTVDITGDTTSYVRWITLGADDTNIVVYESLMNKNLGYQLAAVDVDYTVYIFDRNLDAALPTTGPLLMSNATGAMVIQTPKGDFSMHKRYLRAATTGDFYLPGGRTVMIKNNVNAPPNDDEVTWRCWHGSAAGFDVKNEWHYALTGGSKPFTASPVASWTPPMQRVAL